VVEPHRAASIRRLGRRDVAEFYELREVLEGLAARLAAENIELPGNRERFTCALEAMRHATSATQMPEYIDENTRFHRAIAELAGRARSRPNSPPASQHPDQQPPNPPRSPTPSSRASAPATPRSPYLRAGGRRCASRALDHGWQSRWLRVRAIRSQP